MPQSRIVVVDDDPDIVEAVKVVLECNDFTVMTANNKEDGLALIRAEKPDLAVLDVMMTKWQDGFEMARELKKDSDFKDMPILMLTGVEDKTGLEFKSAAGDPDWLPVNGFLDKPVEPETLIAEVKKLLAK